MFVLPVMDTVLPETLIAFKVAPAALARITGAATATASDDTKTPTVAAADVSRAVAPFKVSVAVSA